MAGRPLTEGAVRALRCPSCGASVPLRAMGWAQTVVCAQCASVLDPTTPELSILARGTKREHVVPRIPLGTRADWRGAPFEVIGFQVRRITVDEVHYYWQEYVLFNPYHGFRYLTEYEGHWSDVVPLPALPEEVRDRHHPYANHAGTTFKHFQTAEAETGYVIGEFPWEARVGDRVIARDFVSPPYMLSAEATPDEETWSLGEYVDAKEVWRAFGLGGEPPPPRGIYANQPSPHAAAKGILSLFLLFALLLAAGWVTRLSTARRAVVHSARFTYEPARPEGLQAVVTPAFELTGGSATVEVATRTTLTNQWMALDVSLIDERSGRTVDLGREIGYYEGVDSEGRWTEGNANDRVRFGPVPAGRYFMRIAPSGGQPSGAPIAYTVNVRHDVPVSLHFIVALLLLAVPPVFVGLRHAHFESQRWMESDHAPVSAGSDDDE